MPDIVNEFTVKAPLAEVFHLFSAPEGLAKWWTKTSTRDVRAAGEFGLYFGPKIDWPDKVTPMCRPRLLNFKSPAHTRIGWALVSGASWHRKETGQHECVSTALVDQTRMSTGASLVTAGQCT